MLILTRRAGELVRIGEDMSVRVLSVDGGHVRLGITAPPEVPVHREEVYMRILRESARQDPRRETRTPDSD